MLKTYYSERDKEFYIKREEGEEFITIEKIKETVKAIKTLFNNPNIEIYVSGGCIDVKPYEGQKMEFDSPIFNEFKVIDIKTKTLVVEIPREGKYQTATLNQKLISPFDKTEYEVNALMSVTFKY